MSIFEFTRHGSRGARAKAGGLALLTMAILVVQFLNQGRKPMLIVCLILHVIVAALIVAVVARDPRR